MMIASSATVIASADGGPGLLVMKASGISDGDFTRIAGKKRLSLFDCYALAVYNTETMKIQEEHSVQAEARRDQAIGAFLPKVSLKALKPWPGYSNNYVTPSQRSNVSLNARQNLFTGLSEIYQYSAAAKDLRAKKYQAFYGAGRLLLEVAAAYCGVLQNEKKLQTGRDILDLYRKMLNELRRRASIGRSRQSEILRTNSQIYVLEAQIKFQENALASARLSLATVAGMSRDAPLYDIQFLRDPAYDAGKLDEKLADRWDIKSAREQVEYADSNLKSAWSGHLPSAYVEGTYYLYQEKFPIPIYKVDPTSGRISVNTTPTKVRNYSVNLGVELPLFSGWSATNRIREAESVRREAALNYSKTVRLARQEILDSYRTWESSGIETRTLKKALESAEQNYRVVTEEYGRSLVTILDVLTSLTTLQNARDQYESAVIRHGLDRIKLGVAVNEFTGPGARALNNSDKR